MKILLFIALFQLSYFTHANANTEAGIDSIKEAQLRNYPGGKDESDIKVQPELHQPTQKVHKRNVHKDVVNSLLKEEEPEKEKR